MVNDEELMVEKIGPGTPGVLINSGLITRLKKHFKTITGCIFLFSDS